VRQVLYGRGTNNQTRKTVKVLGLFTQFPGAPAGTDMVASLSYYQQVTGRMSADYDLAATTGRATVLSSAAAAAAEGSCELP
jgi:hypothetical protein